jgi:hypothetical protein
VTELVNRILIQAKGRFPLALVGVGLIATLLWISAVAAFAFGSIWSAALQVTELL